MPQHDALIRFVLRPCLAFLVAGGVGFVITGFAFGFGVLFGSQLAVVTLVARIVEALCGKRFLHSITFCVGVIALATFWVVYGLVQETRTLETPGTIWLWMLVYANLTLATGCATAVIEVSRNVSTAIVMLFLSFFFLVLAFQ
jgi:hypothetical protein